MTEQNPATPEAPAAPYSQQPAEAPKSGGSKKLLSIIGAVVVIAIVLALKFGVLDRFMNSDDPQYAEVGNCLTGEADVNQVKIIDCGDAKAAQKVLSILDNKNQTQAEEECATVNGAEAYILLSKDDPITAASKGKVLCLGPKA